MNTGVNKRVIVVGLVAIAAAVSALLVTHRPPEPATGLNSETSPAAAQAAATGPSTAAPRSYPGVVLARNAVDLAPKVEGTLEALKVELGQRVSKDTTVAIIDVGPVRQDLAIAQAQLNAAKAQLQRTLVQRKVSKAQLERDMKIADQMSEAELLKGRSEGQIASVVVREAMAHVAECRAKVDQLQGLVNAGEIRAPFDGVVTERYLAIGARVSRSTPILRVIGQNAFGVRFAVPGDDARKVRAGMPVRVEIEGSELSLDGQVENVSPEIDPSIQTLVAEAKLNTTDANANQIPSGQSARIFVLGETTKSQQR